MKINSREELNHLQEYYSSRLNAQKKRILVCAGTGCVAGGSLLIYDRLKELMEEKGMRLSWKKNPMILPFIPHLPVPTAAALKEKPPLD